MRNRVALMSLLIAAGWIPLAAGCGQPTLAETTASTAGAAATSTVERVTAGKAVRQTLQLYTTQPARIEAYQTTPLYPKVSGYVEQVLVDIGDRVEQDQTLVKLWVPEMQDELAQKEALVAHAEAQIRQTEAALHAARAGVATAEAQVRQAEAGTMRAEAEHQRWQAEHARLEELAAAGSVTQKLVDETLHQLRATEAAQQEVAADVRAAQAGVQQAEANVRKAEADLGAAQAELGVAEADRARTRTLLAYAEIKAPYDGVITRRGVDAGHYVHPANGGSTSPLLVVAQSDRVRVQIDIPESEAPLVDAGEQGDAVTVRVQSLGGREFQGKLTRTSWALDESNRSLLAEVEIPNPEGLLRSGMYATVVILLEERANVQTLPTSAIVHEGDQTSCCCVEAGAVHRQPVQLGLRSGDEVEVVDGLQGDEIVVMLRAEGLDEDQQVEVLASEAKQ